MNYKIYNEVNDIIRDYETRPVEIMEGLQFQQYKTIQMCEFYANSKYLGGNKDELQRDKPFYNIVNYRVTLAKVATDLDIKDVTIESDDPKHYVQSMLLQKEAYEWMKASNFSYFLNKWGQTRPKYGGVLAKRTMQIDDDKKDILHIDVVDWRNVATDQVDIESGAIVETHYMTPVDLMKKSEAWPLSDMTDVIAAADKSNAKSSKYDQKHDMHNTDRVIVREATGQFPLELYKNFLGIPTDNEDKYDYSLQHYFYADISGKCFPLFCEEMDEDDFQYMYLPWEEMPGRALGRGIIEDAEEAQVWTNDSVINEKNAMDLAGKVVLKTDSKTVGANILEVDNGRIFEVESGKTLEAINLEPSALGEYQNQLMKWQNQANDATSSYDANSGKQPPADTPYSQTALLNQVAAKPFDYRREEAGIAVSDMFEEWIIPYLVKRLKQGHVLATDFTQDELEYIDDAFSTWAVNQKAIEAIMDGKILSAADYQSAIDAFKLTMKGSRRFLEIPTDFFKDVNANVTVMTTGEQKNKAAVLQSLSTIMADVQKSYNPQTGSFAVLENPMMARIFGTILELSGAGISPASLGLGKASTAPNATASQQTPAVQQPPQPLPVPSPVQNLSQPQPAPVG